MAFTLEIGKPAPSFSLCGVDGRTWTLDDFTDHRILVVVFTCNHCPYVVGSEARMKNFHHDYAPRGVAFVAINANDSDAYPDDSFHNMVVRVKEQGFEWPYLRDETQQTAIAYGAVKTPHYFVFDGARRLRYSGRMDDNPRQPGQETTHELRDAVDAVLAGRDPDPPVTDPIGCTVKWKGKDSHFIPNDACDLTPAGA